MMIFNKQPQAWCWFIMLLLSGCTDSFYLSESLDTEIQIKEIVPEFVTITEQQSLLDSLGSVHLQVYGRDTASTVTNTDGQPKHQLLVDSRDRDSTLAILTVQLLIPEGITQCNGIIKLTKEYLHIEDIIVLVDDTLLQATTSSLLQLNYHSQEITCSVINDELITTNQMRFSLQHLQHYQEKTITVLVYISRNDIENLDSMHGQVYARIILFGDDKKHEYWPLTVEYKVE